MRSNTFWTEAEVDQLKTLAAKGHTANEIAERLGRSPGSVRKKAKTVHGTTLRRATKKGTRDWLVRQFGNLQRRLGTLTRRIDRGDDAATAQAVKQRLRDERTVLDGLLAFAQRHAIPQERYDRVVERIRGKLEAVRAKIQGKRSFQWKEALAMVNLVLGVATNLFDFLVKVYETVGPFLVT